MAGQEIEDVSENAGKFVDLNDDVDELDRGRSDDEGADAETSDSDEDAGTDDDASGEDAGAEKDDGADAKDESGEDGEAEGSDDAAAGDDAGEAEVDPNKAEISSLRQMIRAQRTQLKELGGKLETHEKALVDKDIVTEDELNAGEDNGVDAARDAVLDQMVELMELNPKYEDVKVVCSQGNFDDVAEILAKAYVAEHGGDSGEVADAIASTVWGKVNPYKEMYGLIKDYHPDFAKVEKDAGKADEDKKDKGEKEVVKPAPSLSNMPGGGTGGKGGAGWTAQRIDQMTEDELNDVPVDVYEKYMMGELD